jgi:hypothetical protein
MVLLLRLAAMMVVLGLEGELSRKTDGHGGCPDWQPERSPENSVERGVERPGGADRRGQK